MNEWEINSRGAFTLLAQSGNSLSLVYPVPGAVHLQSTEDRKRGLEKGSVFEMMMMKKNKKVKA